MSTKTFIYSLIALVCTLIVYFLWVSDDVRTSTPLSNHHEAAGDSNRFVKENIPPRSIDTLHGRFAELTDSSIQWQVKVNELRQLDGESLNTEEVGELYQLLKYQPSTRDREGWLVVLNELMEQMRKQGIGKERYTDTLLGVIENPSIDLIARDYAIQHLSMWITPREGVDSYHEEDSEKVKTVIDTLSQVIQDSSSEVQESSMPGTALMALVDISQNQFETEEIKNVFLELRPWLENVIDGTQAVPLMTRTSAINVAGIMNLKEYTPYLRSVIQTVPIDKVAISTLSQTDASLMLTSIAAMGYLAEESDATSLQSIANGDTKFKHAAQSALRNYNSRKQN